LILIIVGISIAIIAAIVFSQKKRKIITNQWNKVYNQSDKIWN
jgi:uncharacterized membrane protein YgaE (UPF0421/DUF939 family)